MSPTDGISQNIDDGIRNEDIIQEQSVDETPPVENEQPPEEADLLATVDPFQRSRHSLIRSPAVRSPISGSLFTVLAFTITPLLLIGFLLLPWQQSAIGVGSVSSLSPANRPQKIEAPVEGQIVEWHVSEGMVVTKGTPLLLLQDTDPNRLERLQSGLTLGTDQLQSMNMKKDRYIEKLDGQRASLAEKLNEIDAKILSLKNKEIGMRAELNTEQTQLDRYAQLLEEGIVSTRDYELAKLKRDKADSALGALLQQIDGMQSQKNSVAEAGRAKIAEIEAEITEVDAKISSIGQKQLDIESKVAKQSTQQVLAPSDGVVFRIEGGIIGEQIKKGESLMQFVPTSDDRIVEIEIDGNDISLVEVGQEVRLIFEGWPALQFVGFPGADAGTYAGKVRVIDGASSKKGSFRILVEPDPEQHPWPEHTRLRQGIRVKGWVLLGTVPLGYEIWRRINGFPPLPSVEKGNKVQVPVNKKPKKSVLEVQ